MSQYDNLPRAHSTARSAIDVMLHEAEQLRIRYNKVIEQNEGLKIHKEQNLALLGIERRVTELMAALELCLVTLEERGLGRHPHADNAREVLGNRTENSQSAKGE